MDIMLENLYVSRELYSFLLHPVCTKYDLAPAELLVLLFLANNTEYDTAKDKHPVDHPTDNMLRN